MSATGGSARPACDNCKDRKTKCDRASPCSSCATAGLECCITRRASERRQRVLISTRYDEAMENVNRSLQEVSQAVKKLLLTSEKPQPSQPHSPAVFAAGQSVDMAGAFEGYRGDSSFKAHVQRVTDALRDTASDLELNTADTSDTAFSLSPSTSTNKGTTPNLVDASSPSAQVTYPELQGRPLPSLNHVLGLLRLAQAEQQRFFMDVPVIDEPQFADYCQKVYFAVTEYSISAWAIVNTGLFYLFHGLKEHNYPIVGVNVSDIQLYRRLLTANIEAVIQSLRLCQDQSVETGQALSLLSMFCNKSGRGTVAWTLISAASRMCIDLGWHRLPKKTDEEDHRMERSIFWHIYIMDKGMALTLGRTPSIHQYDVATERPTIPKGLPDGVPGYLYAGVVEFAFVIGDMHMELYSAAAQRGSQKARVESARSLASRLTQINSNVKQLLLDRPPGHMFRPATVLFEVIVHCLMTIVYRVVPCDEPNASPLQCNASCIEAARQALSTIVQAHESWGQHDPTGWTMLLNLLFSLVPFASFVVLAGNTVASSSVEDLALLSAAVLAMEPITTGSESGEKLVGICKTFEQLARASVARQTALSSGPLDPVADTSPGFRSPAGSDSSTHQDDPEALSYEHTMAPQDWDTIMDELGMGVGAGAMASFVEPYMPFGGMPP